jgi:hypothetical protein
MFPKPFMTNALRALVGNNVPATTVWKGPSMSRAALQAQLTKTGALLDPENSLKSLLDNRVMKIGQVNSVAHARAALKDEAATEEFRTRPLCVDPVNLVFRKYDKFGNRVPNVPPTPVEFVPHPGDTMTKLKHYWIYSGVSTACGNPPLVAYAALNRRTGARRRRWTSLSGGTGRTLFRTPRTSWAYPRQHKS